MRIALPGTWPRSETLVQATRDADRGRIRAEELRVAEAEDRRDFAALQSGPAFPHVSPGSFDWPDLLRPFAALCPSTEVGTLTRFFETNTFCKELQLPRGAHPDEAALGSWLERWFLPLRPAPAGSLCTLPFVPLFREFSNATPEEAARLLETVARGLAGPGRMIVFYDPCFGWRSMPEEEIAACRQVLDVTRSAGGGPVVVHTAFFELDPRSRKVLFGLPADGFGVDFTANAFDTILPEIPKGALLLAGIVSTETTRIEDSGLLRGIAERLARSVDPAKTWLTTGGAPDLLPRSVMDAKVRALREVVR